MGSQRLVLDDATGTELNRCGVDTGLPSWSANALTRDVGLSVLRHVHLDYLDAGADIITTNTFRTNRRVLAGKSLSAEERALRAVAIAKEAAAEFGKPSLKDCYRPDLVPAADECLDKNSERIRHLVDGGIDLLLIATMNSIREVLIAAKIATATGLPTWVSFSCDEKGRILTGESLTHAAEILVSPRVKTLGVNCMPVHTLAQPRNELRTVCAGDQFTWLPFVNIQATLVSLR